VRQWVLVIKAHEKKTGEILYGTNYFFLFNQAMNILGGQE
jgi:hypothetical protein